MSTIFFVYLSGVHCFRVQNGFETVPEESTSFENGRKGEDVFGNEICDPGVGIGERVLLLLGVICRDRSREE